MTDTDPTRGIELDKQPHKSILKRIDIGLMTGLCALLISFVGVITSRATFNMNQETQKARVLPIIDIDMGYIGKPDAQGVMKQYFEVTLNNVGAGIAHIQSVTPTRISHIQEDKPSNVGTQPIESFEEFEASIMTGRMRSWATLTETPAAGYVRAGESVTPVSYRMGAAESDLSAYLRGEWGMPMEDLDLTVCYCSVFEDCWTINYVDRKTPKPVKSCGIDDVPVDMFQSYIDQRIAKRQAANNE